MIPITKGNGGKVDSGALKLKQGVQYLLFAQNNINKNRVTKTYSIDLRLVFLFLIDFFVLFHVVEAFRTCLHPAEMVNIRTDQFEERSEKGNGPVDHWSASDI